MPDVNIWALAGTGLAAGFLGAMLGIGGGAIIVPVLTLFLGVPIHNAIAVSLISIVTNACTATGIYIRNHMTNLKLGVLLGIALVPGAVLGGLLASIMTATALSVIFSLILVYVAFRLFPRKQKAEIATSRDGIKEKDHAQHSWLDGHYYDPATDQEVNYQVHRPVVGMASGLFAGIISTLIGIGGGIINVPVMIMLMKVPFKAAIATSSFLLAITTMTGSLFYSFNGYIQPDIAAPLIISTYIGSRAGAAFSRRSQNAVLSGIFAAFALCMAVLMVLRAFNILGR
jgi:uncharacterized membrane protein YfcA